MLKNQFHHHFLVFIKICDSFMPKLDLLDILGKCAFRMKTK